MKNEDDSEVKNNESTEGRSFKGCRVTPENRWSLIRAKQLELMSKGVDEQVAYYHAKREIRREQKHLKAFLQGKSSFRFGVDEDDKPNIVYVL